MLFIDCGHTVAGRHYTGIQRYVRRTLRHAAALFGAHRVRAMRPGPHGWSGLDRLPAHPMEGLPDLLLEPRLPALDRDSRVLLADRFWHTGAWTALDELLASPARITLVVYDLLSLRRPEWFPQGVGERFGRYLRAVLPRADDVVCLSRVVQAELEQWARTQIIAASPARVVRPGHETWTGEPHPPSWLPPDWQDDHVPLVLQVGTLEPRKNQRLTLEAMRLLWREGHPARCLLVGQDGWGMDGFAATLASEAEWKSRLFWTSECTDAELEWCYRRASVLCFPSSNEGYGLPLAEAAALGTSVLATDTPVHRELAALFPGQPVRLSAAEPQSLADHLRTSCISGAAVSPPRRRSWADATAELLAPLAT